MSLYFGHAALGATLFLLALVGLRPQGRRWYLDILLLGVWVLILAWVAASFGIRTALIAAGMSLLYGAVLLPLAAPTARALYGPEPPETWRGPHVPSERLRSISLALAQDPAAVEVLIAVCEADPAVREVMLRHGASRGTLAALYRKLVEGGSGRWAGEHYVPASTLADPTALEWMLRSDRGGSEADHRALAAYFEWAAPLPETPGRGTP